MFASLLRAAAPSLPPVPMEKANLMNREPIAHNRPVYIAHNRPVYDELHPRVYGVAVGLVAWFALAAWILFDRQDDVELSLMFVSVLLFVAVLLPWLLSLVWQRYDDRHDRHARAVPFREWRTAEFAVWGSTINSTHATIDMLLPLASVAFGLTAIGIVFLICASLAP
ncbi:hypothetical protein [Bradyrhizobium ivorense]|nr:hypothetical protein [Bradyrhizobium ivorense]